MTRINTVFPMLDEHLRAARKEYPRIPSKVLELWEADAWHRLDKAPTAYTVQTADNPKGGKGHMMFFCDKLTYVYDQYQAIRAECARRGFTGGEFKNADLWHGGIPEEIEQGNGSAFKPWNDYTPTVEAIELCKRRMIERIPDKPHYCGELITHAEAVRLITVGYI